jgi:hypothetical protein
MKMTLTSILVLCVLSSSHSMAAGTAGSPGKDRQSNWLPAPKAPFWMVLRTYGPGEGILNGSYKVPPVMVTQSK